MPHQNPIVLEFARPMPDDEFFLFCQKNNAYRIERQANGLIMLEEPSGLEYGRRNIAIIFELEAWNRKHTAGIVTDSGVGFTLPNSAMRAPDASWISNNRLAVTTPEDREVFVHAVPEFVVEVRSYSDRLGPVRQKMHEYIANGVLLGWLVDVSNEAVEIYRPGREMEVVKGFDGTLTGGDVLPGFVFDLGRLK